MDCSDYCQARRDSTSDGQFTARVRRFLRFRVARGETLQSSNINVQL